MVTIYLAMGMGSNKDAMCVLIIVCVLCVYQGGFGQTYVAVAEYVITSFTERDTV